MRGERSQLVARCALAVLLAVSAGSCGASAGSPTQAAADTAPRTAAAGEATHAPAADAGRDERTRRAQIERSFAPNPDREPAAPRAHPGAAVDRVIVHDVRRGRGLAVRPGDSIYADYIAANYTAGRKFMTAWKDSEPYPTEHILLSTMMRGFQIGVRGMRPGGRRTIVVPARLSDVDDPDRAGNSYREIVYFDVVLRSVVRPRG